MTFLLVYLFGLFPGFWFAVKYAANNEEPLEEGAQTTAYVIIMTIIWPLMFISFSVGFISAALNHAVNNLVIAEKDKNK